MATLKHYKALNPTGANVYFDVMGEAVPAGEALAISRITIANLTSAVAQKVVLLVDTAVGAGAGTIFMLTIEPGEQVTETALVAVAGERVYARTDLANAGNLAVNVFGELGANV